MKTLKLISLILALILVLGCITVSAEEYTAPDPILYGDVDMDGEVTIKDATAIQKGIAELEYLTSVQRFLADPDKAGLSIKNATAIQKKISGIYIGDSPFGSVVNMELHDKFSSHITINDNTEVDRIRFWPINRDWEYTLADFPEYDFLKIEIKHIELEYGQDYDEWYLYLSNPSKDSVEKAIRALDYRANLDLHFVSSCTYDYIDDLL